MASRNMTMKSEQSIIVVGARLEKCSVCMYKYDIVYVYV